MAFLLILVSMATLKKTNKSKMLAGKKWTKGNHYKLLVEMQISPVTTEVNMEVSQETKSRYDPATTKLTYHRDICMLIFIVALLFTISIMESKKVSNNRNVYRKWIL